MKALVERLKAVFADPLFLRVCVVLWGSAFVAIGWYAVAHIHPSDMFEWVGLVLFGLLGIYGSFLVTICFVGSKSLVERSTSFVSESEDLVGVVFAVVVGVVAVPVTVMLRAALNRRRG